MKALLICKKCKTPYIDDVLETDNHTFCPNPHCKEGTWLKDYNFTNVSNIKRIYWWLILKCKECGKILWNENNEFLKCDEHGIQYINDDGKWITKEERTEQIIQEYLLKFLK